MSWFCKYTNGKLLEIATKIKHLRFHSPFLVSATTAVDENCGDIEVKE